MARGPLYIPTGTADNELHYDQDGTTVHIDTDDGLVKFKAARSVEAAQSIATDSNTLTFTNKTHTSPTLNAPVKHTLAVSTVGSSLTSTLAAGAASGSVYALNAAAGFSTTLPDISSNANNGVYYRFVVRTAPTGGTGYIFVTTGSANIIMGNVSSADLDAIADAGWDDDGDTITFVNDAAAIGDWIEVVAIDSRWFVSGSCKTVTGITITKAS